MKDLEELVVKFKPSKVKGNNMLPFTAFNNGKVALVYDQSDLTNEMIKSGEHLVYVAEEGSSVYHCYLSYETALEQSHKAKKKTYEPKKPHTSSHTSSDNSEEEDLSTLDKSHQMVILERKLNVAIKNQTSSLTALDAAKLENKLANIKLVNLRSDIKQLLADEAAAEAAAAEEVKKKEEARKSFDTDGWISGMSSVVTTEDQRNNLLATGYFKLTETMSSPLGVSYVLQYV